MASWRSVRAGVAVICPGDAWPRFLIGAANSYLPFLLRTNPRILVAATCLGLRAFVRGMVLRRRLTERGRPLFKIDSELSLSGLFEPPPANQCHFAP
jgi:hypothetical protein